MVVWEDGDDLLGDPGVVVVDDQTGDQGCENGIHTSGNLGFTPPCLDRWRFFDLMGESKFWVGALSLWKINYVQHAVPIGAKIFAAVLNMRYWFVYIGARLIVCE